MPGDQKRPSAASVSGRFRIRLAFASGNRSADIFSIVTHFNSRDASGRGAAVGELEDKGMQTDVEVRIGVVDLGQRGDDGHAHTQFLIDLSMDAPARVFVGSDFAAGELPAILKTIALTPSTNQDAAGIDNKTNGDMDLGHIWGAFSPV